MTLMGRTFSFFLTFWKTDLKTCKQQTSSCDPCVPLALMSHLLTQQSNECEAHTTAWPWQSDECWWSSTTTTSAGLFYVLSGLDGDYRLRGRVAKRYYVPSLYHIAECLIDDVNLGLLAKTVHVKVQYTLWPAPGARSIQDFVDMCTPHNLWDNTYFEEILDQCTYHISS